MLLRHFINVMQSHSWPWRLTPLLICTLLVSGCHSMPMQSGSETGADGRPLPPGDIPPEALTLFERAVAEMAAGDSLEAELRFQEFLLFYPDYPGAHVNLAIIYSDRGDDAAAAASISDALIVDPQHPVALNQLGMLLRRQGRFPEAEAAYMKAITADPDYALAHYNVGVLNELYLQRLDVALQHYEHYQALSSEDKQVQKWIVDLKRRISAHRRTANVTE